MVSARAHIYNLIVFAMLSWRYNYKAVIDNGISVPKITQNSYCTLLWRARGAGAYNVGLGAEPLDPAVCMYVLLYISTCQVAM